MKIRIYFASLALIFVALFTSCEDISDIGVIIQPDQDKLSVKADSFHLATSTVFVDSVYSESKKIALGSCSDPTYGTFNADFLADFRYIKNYTFPENLVDSSLYLVMYYKTFFGDSLAVQEATAYRMTNQVLDFETNYYSNQDLAPFCDKSEVLGKVSYTAYDKTIHDSVRSADDFYNAVRIPLPEQMLHDFTTNTDLYESQQNFLAYLKGVYVTNRYGQGVVLNIDSVNIELPYTYLPDISKPDSILSSVLIFPSNKETSQVNRVQHPNDLHTEIDLSDDYEYVSSPAGLFTKITVPYDRIYERVVVPQQSANDTNYVDLNLNNVTLVVKPFDDNSYSGDMSEPPALLMIAEDNVIPFFTQSLYPAPGITALIGLYDEVTGRYIFNDMSGLLKEVLDQKQYALQAAEQEGTPSESLEYEDLLLVPISGVTDISGTNATIRHQFVPYAAKLKSGTNSSSPMRLSITYTDL